MGRGTLCLGFKELWEGGEEFPQLGFRKKAISSSWQSTSKRMGV